MPYPFQSCRGSRTLFRSRLLAGWAVITLAFGAFACGDDESSDPPPPPGPDVTAPADITDLRHAAGGVTSTTILLNWTAPGDDGESGQAAEYDLRLSTEQITSKNWREATRYSNTSRPLQPLLTERVTVSGLQPSTLYYFVVSTADEADNWSGLSNFYAVQTDEPQDRIPPDPIADLSVMTTSSSSITLTWTATGDDRDIGTAFGYDIGYLDVPINEDNWIDVMSPREVPVPLPAGSTETYELTDLDPGTSYYVAIRVWDDATPTRLSSALSNVVLAETLPGGRP